MLTATKDELTQRVQDAWSPIQSFSMRTYLSPSVLNPRKGTATDYATVGAFVLFRKPQEVRILAQDPIVGSTLFDMVSNGSEFRVSIPRKKRFVIGSNDAPGTSENNLENLRPAALLSSLMIYPIDPEADVTALENDDEHALYILLIIRRVEGGFVITRSICFDRHTLEITRQKAFDRSGELVSDTKYSDWKRYSGISFPCSIDIQRPKDNYEVQLSVLSMRMNTPDITAQKFILDRPPNSELQSLR